MADLTDPRIASGISQHLTDIATKLEGIRAFKNLSIDLDLPDVENFNAKLEDEYRKLKGVRKVWADLGKDLYEVKRRKLELFRAEEQLRRQADNVYKQQQKARAAAVRDPAREQELQDHYDELSEKLKHVNKGLAEMARNQKEVEVITKHAKRSFLDFSENALNKGFTAAFQFATAGIRGLETVVLKSYEINNRFRAAFAGIAQAVGAATPELGEFQKTAQQLYFERGGLGDLGMDVGQIAGEVGGFASALGIMDRSLVANAGTLVAHAKALGLDAASAGDVSRSFLLMGQGAADVDAVMGRILKDSRQLGVSAAGLAKNVLVLGKNLLAMAGPKWQLQMVQAIETLTRVGVSVQSLESFTRLTDVFDHNAEAMAKLNTAFGTHINALQVFAEEDPAKRFRMVTEQLEQQGKSVQNLGRQEKQFLAQTLGITLDEVNAITRGTKSFDEAADKLKKTQDTTADWNAALMELRTTLVNWGRIFDKVLVSVMHAMQPLLKAVGLDGPLGSGLQGITGLAERFGDRVSAAFERLTGPEGAKFREGMQKIGDVIERAAKSLLDFLASPEFPRLIERITGLFTFLIDHGEALVGIWLAFKALVAGAQLYSALSTIGTAIGGLSGAMGALSVASLAAFWWIAPLVALLAAAGYLAATSTKPTAEQAAAQQAGSFGAAGAAPTGFSGATLLPTPAPATSAAPAPVPAPAPAPAMGAFGGGGTGRAAGQLGGGSAPAPDIRLTQPIQVYVDGNLASEQNLVSNLRQHQGGA